MDGGDDGVPKSGKEKQPKKEAQKRKASPKKKLPQELDVHKGLAQLTELPQDADFARLKEEAEWEIGVDEAGRGPVLGPMVYGCCLWPTQFRNCFKTQGLDDSKKLSVEKREKLFEMLKQSKGRFLDYETHVISAREISEKMLSKVPFNLNKLSKESAIKLIQRAIDNGFNVKYCYLDTVGPKETYQREVMNSLSRQNLTVEVSEKADSIYPIVSAASICAKVTRDAKLKELLGKDHEISGYPGDPRTVSWLDRNYIPFFGFADQVRFSWSTVEELMRKKGDQVLYDVEDEQKKRQSSQQQLQLQNDQETNHRGVRARFSFRFA